MKKRMRQTYTLSDETRLVLSGNAKAIANELDKSDKYIYGILADTEPDRFAQFLPIYSAAVRAGAAIEHWINKLEAIKARYAKAAPSQSVAQVLADKITTDANTTKLMIEALADDGKIDAREAVKIQQAIDKEKENLAALEAQLHHRQAVD